VQCRLHEAEKYLIVQEGCFNLLQLKMHLQDWSQIDILSWGGRATGINPDWCLTPGIKQKVTSVHLCIHLPMGYKSAGKKLVKILRQIVSLLTRRFGRTIEIFVLEQVCLHWSSKNLGGKTTL
jgi:hypothetical protein